MKIRVLIVEDEPPIARAVARLVAANPAFEVGAVALNGYDALDQLEASHFDLLITDINMPVMDGLSLAAHVEKHQPHIIKVILTGYQKFEYARQAINYRVFDYLLKPVTPEKMDELLKRVEARWHERDTERRRGAIAAALEGGEAPEAGEDRYLMALLCAGAYLDIDTGLSLGQAFWDAAGLNRLVRQALGGQGGYHIGHGQAGTEVTLVLPCENADETQALLARLFETLDGQTALPLTVIYSDPASLPQLNRLRRDLQQEMRRHARLFSSRLMRLGAEPDTTPAAYSDGQVEEIVRAACAGDEAGVTALLTGVLERFKQEDQTQRAFIRLVESVIHDGRLSGRLGMARYEETRFELLEALGNSAEAAGLAKDIASILVRIVPAGEDQAKKGTAETVEAVEEYLQKNYLRNISSEMLSAAFGYVPSYLSKVFRQAKGVSPSEYLVRLRVEKAKQLWGEDPHILVKDVAEAVGYRDPYYFSKVFKKETGDWPKDYQNKLGVTGD